MELGEREGLDELGGSEVGAKKILLIMYQIKGNELT